MSLAATASRARRARRRGRRVGWAPREVDAWQPPEEMVPSKWADRYRVLSSRASAEPGPWRTERTPYLREPLDAIADPHVESLVVMASTQLGKTELELNWLGYIVDQDPGPTMMVVPRTADVEAFARGRILPMLEDSPKLAAHLLEGRGMRKPERIELDRMPIYCASAHSPADLASKPCRTILYDEVDKYPLWAGREADPLELGDERLRTFPGAKSIKVSTPTTPRGYISKAYAASDQRRYFVPCPFCGTYQVLYFPAIKWPDDERDPERIRTERLAWYECPECRKPWDDADKARALPRGVWCPEGAKVTGDGQVEGATGPSRRRGYWLNALYSPWVTWSDVAAKFLSSKDEPRLLMNFTTSWLAEPWEDHVEEPKAEILAKRAGKYPEGTVPDGGLVLCAGVDVQKDSLYVVIRAWGYGEESWLVRACRVEGLEEAVVVLFRTLYPRARRGTKPLGVRMVCVDSGYRTDEVYEVCRAWGHVARPVKGHDYLAAGMTMRVSYLDRDVRGRPDTRGLALWHLDSSYFKDKLARLCNAAPGDPAQWHLFRDPSPEYLSHLTAEHKVLERNRRTGRAREVWKMRHGRLENHYLDAEVYGLAAADMLRVPLLRKTGELEEYRPRQVSLGASPKDRGRKWVKAKAGGWFKR